MLNCSGFITLDDSPEAREDDRSQSPAEIGGYHKSRSLNGVVG